MANGTMANHAAIPVIDLSSQNAASELLDAASTFGFVFVRHEGLNLAPEQVDRMFQLVRLSLLCDEHMKMLCKAW